MSHFPDSTPFFESVRHKIFPPADLPDLIARIREEGKTIATLNGSFDLLHAGHLEMIYQASLQADVLLLALNTDRSIREYKSSNRPIIPLQRRLMLIAALELVDFVTYFDETDPIRMLEVVKPDVHVNGAEYGEECIEASTVKKHGGRIHIVSLVPGLSTSRIVDKIMGRSV